jgi:hypothetical protein
MAMTSSSICGLASSSRQLHYKQITIWLGATLGYIGVNVPYPAVWLRKYRRTVEVFGV